MDERLGPKNWDLPPSWQNSPDLDALREAALKVVREGRLVNLTLNENTAKYEEKPIEESGE